MMNITKTVIVLLSIAFFSCTKNEELYYAKDKREMNIWLGASNAPVDSLTYNFSYTTATHDSVLFNYRLAGYPLDHDTEFEIQAVSGDTSLVHYSFGKYIVKAGTYQGVAPIYIDRPAGYNEFKSSTGRIAFTIKPSSAYIQGAKELSTLYVLFKNFITKPDNWDVAPAGYFTMSRYFGTYSNVKYSFVIQTTGMVDFKIFYTTQKDPSLGENTITATQAQAFQARCKVALQAYNEQHGTLLDENNNPVVFP